VRPKLLATLVLTLKVICVLGVRRSTITKGLVYSRKMHIATNSAILSIMEVVGMIVQIVYLATLAFK